MRPHPTRTRLTSLCVLLGLCVSVPGDYITDRRAAEKLVRAEQWPEAMAAFVEMAGTAASDVQRSDALEQAAMCAQKLGTANRAMELAEQIPLAPVSRTVRMRLMLQNGKHAELIAAFEDDEARRWPDKVAGEAFYCRGRAYVTLKDGKAAETQLREALKHLADESAIALNWLTLADNYRDNLRDDESALEAYTRVREVGGVRDRYGWKYLSSLTSAAEILRRHGRHGEALQVLDRADLDNLRGYWRGAMLHAYGQTLAAQGRIPEAIEKLRDALDSEDVPAARKDACRQTILQLRKQTR